MVAVPARMCSDPSSGEVSVVQLCREIAARKETPYRALCFRLRCSLCSEYAGTPEPATLVSTHLVECTSSVGDLNKVANSASRNIFMMASPASCLRYPSRGTSPERRQRVNDSSHLPTLWCAQCPVYKGSRHGHMVPFFRQ